ncbi:hypothetical protein F4553_004647 [Allocatelliglobosispora scoriae]|uniref:Uncharacterized protein n=1 Tax=Allocatelliglobosispora scoriae TaxID=643052 RepID=A0A841BUY9_9ACTN|nr:hypothetical protein [Allocatelliglobosispora scoriae]MBB5871268.1 hypothetical protein [Allocatelliglobosispora scoriae]
MSTFAELDAHTTEDLRELAFAKAKSERDVSFFWDLFQHLPSATEAEVGDNSLGDIGPQVDDYVGLWREFTGHNYGEQEPLIRARFIDYLLNS